MNESLNAPIRNLSESAVDGKGTPRSAINRRDLLRLTFGGGAGLALTGLLDVPVMRAATKDLKLSEVSALTTSCNFCSCGCPFCETDSQRLASVTIEGEPGLRIDHCESCGGYLKTYDGQGDETLLLSDWSSLHLDLIAHDRGLKRLAASLYEFEPERNRSRARTKSGCARTRRPARPLGHESEPEPVRRCQRRLRPVA